MHELYILLRPVLFCIILSIVWVKVSNPVSPLFDTGLTASAPDIFQGGVSSVVSGSTGSASSGSGDSGASIKQALEIIGEIIGATIIILLLVANLALDYVTFFVFLWNFVAVGLVVIFWKGPLWLQQVYLVVMSSMMV
ncbi:hypothetical protein HK405_015775 [Cladochytrium tenue]|nr:hypothetical protein HK405_015775 [Cladochytrium tenue]